jgi:nucleoside-diphosphate-sugar epimerase
LHREIDYLAAHPYSNWYHYAIAKRASANLLMTIPKRSFHCPITSLFGPGFRLEDDHLIHSLVRKIVDGQTFGTPVHLGCGDDLKECVYTPDLVQNVMKLQDTRCFNNLRIFNLGSPKKRDTIARIAELICAEIGYPFEKVSFSLSDASSSKKWLDSTMAQTEIKLADTEWTEALQKTIAYYMTIQECNSCESH